MATTATEDYLKQILLLEQSQTTSENLISMGQLAEAMGVVPGTVTAMVKRLAESRLLTYEPYGGVRLTDLGIQQATAILRRHRLIEAFLVDALGLDWSEVHDEAERLEHAISDLLLEHIDAFLNYPTTDPHGDPIPREDTDSIAVERPQSVADFRPGDSLKVVRILDQSQAFLRFIDTSKLRPGMAIEILTLEEIADSITLQPAEGSPVTLGRVAAAKILAEPITKQ